METTSTGAITSQNTTLMHGPIYTCEHCHIPYDWRRSPSSLKMTYCGSLCEIADLGFAIESILRFERPAA